MTCAFLMALLLFTGCATIPDQEQPQEPQALPEGHPPLKVAYSHGFATTQAEAYASYMYGLMLADEGQTREALGYLQMASRIDTRVPQILDEMMRIYIGEGMRSEAEETAGRLLKIDSKWVNAHIILGQIYLDTDRPFEAVNHLEIALELDPERTNILFLLADALEKTGDIKGAIASLEELSKTEDHEAVAYYYIARLYLRTGDVEASLDPLAQAIKLNPSFLKGVEEVGGQLEDKGRTDEAIGFYKGYLQRDPDRTVVREILARALIREERYEEAKKQIDIILEKEPENYGALLITGLIEAKKGNLDKALEIFSNVRATAPGNFDLVLQIGILQRQLEMYSESVTTFRDASLLAPTRYEPHLNLSVVYDLTGQLDKAIESARTALDLDPERNSVRTYLAQLLVKNSRLAEAEKILQEGLVKTPDDTVLLYQLAITQDRSGRFDLAESVLKRIIEIDPEHFDALNYLGYSWADRDMNLDQSLVMIKKALGIKPDAAYIIDSLGWVYYRMGQYEEALKYLLEAGKKMDGDPTVLEHIGDTYEKLGKADLAVKFWSLALKADPGNASVTEKLKNKGVIETAP